MDDITSPLVEEAAPVDESAPADLSPDLDRLAVIEAELAQAEAELDALDAAPSGDEPDPDDAPAS